MEKLKDNYRIDSFEMLARRNYSTTGAIGSFDYIPHDITQHLIQFTIFAHTPIFKFPNGMLINMEYYETDKGLRWRWNLQFDEFVTDWFLDSEFKDWSDKLYNFSDLLRTFMYFSDKNVEAWIKKLSNKKRRTWKTSEEFLNSKEFKKEFEENVDRAVEDNRRLDSFRFPDKKYEFSKPEYKDWPKPVEYWIKKSKTKNINNIEVILHAVKWKKTYTLKIGLYGEKVEFVFDDILKVEEVLEQIEGFKTDEELIKFIKENSPAQEKERKTKK